ncbi:MAG: ABC transporter substrate-binding protein [Clostridia bacterium]|nr:ABC transporter substrate-binding protein [Clostridia bacterium]
MKKFLPAIALIWILVLSAGCAPQAEKEEILYAFSDDAGNIVGLSAAPQKVAVLFSSFAEVWNLAGGEVAISVGESVERGFCDADTLLVDNGAGKTIDTERLLSYEPDLVIGSADIEAHAETAALLKNAGIPCALFRTETFGDYLRMLQICTDITGDSDAYMTYGIGVQQKIDELLTRISALAEEPRVLFIRSGSGASSAKAKTAGQHFAAAMLEELGAYNIADDAPVLLDGLSLEAILREDPAVIFVSTMGDETAAKTYMNSLLEQPSWQALSAVQNGSYNYLPKDLFQYKPNARWAEAYEYLAELLYPETFADE